MAVACKHSAMSHEQTTESYKYFLILKLNPRFEIMMHFKKRKLYSSDIRYF